MRVPAIFRRPLLALSAAGPAAAQPGPGCDAAVTGGGTPEARWTEASDPEARSGRVFTEATRLPIADRYPICAFAAPLARDLDATLRFKPVGGRMDRAGGLAVRVVDRNTYYVVRANAAEDNVRLYHVTGGRRVQFAGREGVRIGIGAWHALRLRLTGDRFAVWFDSADQAAPLFEARDSRIAGPGRVALWSIADSHTLFEQPVVEVLRP